jgi:hypothetical protein
MMVMVDGENEKELTLRANPSYFNIHPMLNPPP